jgi:hypothetical protein
LIGQHFPLAFADFTSYLYYPLAVAPRTLGVVEAIAIGDDISAIAIIVGTLDDGCLIIKKCFRFPG